MGFVEADTWADMVYDMVERHYSEGYAPTREELKKAMDFPHYGTARNYRSAREYDGTAERTGVYAKISSTYYGDIYASGESVRYITKDGKLRDLKYSVSRLADKGRFATAMALLCKTLDEFHHVWGGRGDERWRIGYDLFFNRAEVDDWGCEIGGA